MIDSLFEKGLYLFDGTPVLNIIAIALFTAAAIRSNHMPYVVIFLVYAALHHAYAVPCLLLGDAIRLRDFHLISTPNVVISGVAFLIVWLAFVFRDVRDYLVDDSIFTKVYLVCIGILVCTLFVENIYSDLSDFQIHLLKDSTSLLATLLFAYVISIIIRHVSRPWSVYELRAVSAVSVLVLGIAAYEVLNGFAWASGLYSNGMLYRASSTMLNPNVLGLWGGLLIFFGGYLFDQNSRLKRYGYGMLLLGVIGIFITGSRSSFVFCAAVLSIASCLQWFVSGKFKHSFQYLITFTGLFFLACISGQYLNLISSGFSSLQPLSERFLALPELFFSIALEKTLGVDFLANDIDQNSMLSVYGRIGVPISEGEEIYDNAYLGLISSGLMTFYAWLLMILLFLVAGIKKFLEHKDQQGVYALSSLFGFIIIGLFIRAYQVFPVWGISSLMLAVFIVWVTTDESVSIRKMRC